nr:citron rho-interacting kinase isoform X1 [Helicoverpa armigera]
MEPSKEAIAVRITRLNRLILGKVTGGTTRFSRKTIDREALLDALTVLYDECNDDPVKKSDDLVKAFLDKYRSTLAELRRTRVCISDFEMIQTIGRGHFGEVHMVREKQTCDVYALKTLRKEQARKRADDERDVLAAATGPWMPKLQYAFQDSSNLYLVMELCCGGDLAGLLARRSQPLCERDAAFYVAEVAHALKALHAMGYVHRDVKPHNILLDRCGHVKLGDFGSAARLSEGGCGGVAPATADYMAPELLAAADCAAHTVCQHYCARLVTSAISSCDYWSLGVIAFELVTLRRPFSSGDDDSIAQILSNIQSYERSSSPQLPWDEPPASPSREWRSLTAGLLRVVAGKRYSYLDTLQHAALAHLPAHNIRDQAPPWVPLVRGAEDAAHFSVPARAPPPPSAQPFRTRPPFAGQLPFVGYSYVSQDDSEEHSVGFNASHDCTAIDLATFKSAEKLAAMRSREITSLQAKLAEAESQASAGIDRVRNEAEAEAERQRARLQAEITALSLQNKRLERQVEVEREERMALQRSNQELSSSIAERNSAEVRSARAAAAALQVERDTLRDDLQRLEGRLDMLAAECKRAEADADAARAQQQHYKDIIERVYELRHRAITELNVRPIDTIAKERALRRQTLSGDADSRSAVRVAAADAAAANEMRARQATEKKLAILDDENKRLTDELDAAAKTLASMQEKLNEKQREATTASEQMKELQVQLAQERVKASTLLAQVQELERGVEASVRRESALEEQCARTEARLSERLRGAEQRAATALHDDARHREKVNTLEQLVRQLEREVSALEKRSCAACAAAASTSAQPESERSTDPPSARTPHSDTESVADAHAHAHVSLLKEQLERAEAQLQARAEEIASLRQEARAANLARWRKEREYNELSVETKSSMRDFKRLEERLNLAVEARRTAEQKAIEANAELAKLRPEHEHATKEVERMRSQLDKLTKAHEVVQAEVERSRNDIRKLKSELQYSEKRRLHAEEQEELSSRERSQLRDELQEVRRHNNELVQNNKALQDACGMLEEQLTDLEKIADIHELKNKDLEGQLAGVRTELESCRSRLGEAEAAACERGAAASRAALQHTEARDQARHAHHELQLLRERLEARETRVAELEARAASLESTRAAGEAALGAAARRVRELQEECAALRTRAHHHHAHALQLQATLHDLQEELAAAREAAEAASAWWRTRETKADATLRQQAKLIDFLQAKVEEAGRKKCSLSNKLFGRSGRRTAASPPLRRANRELREEVERLRAKLAACNAAADQSYPSTPKREKAKPIVNGSNKSIDSPDGAQDKGLLIVWSDGSRERMRARCVDECLLLSSGSRELRGQLLAADAKNLPHNEANRAFMVKLENCDRGQSAAVVCGNIAERSAWMSRLRAAAPAPPGYVPALLAPLASEPAAALYVAPNATAIGCADGLHSLRGAVRVEGAGGAVSGALAAGGRALLVVGGALVQAGLLALGSALRRAASLRPALPISPVPLPDNTPPHVMKAIAGDAVDGPCAAVACGRRVFLLRYDASTTEFKIARSLTVDRPANSLLLTTKTLYIAGEKPLKVNLPSGALESFGMDEPTVAAAAKKHSPPKAFLLIKDKPTEILLCYAECGIFVDENGKRTRNEDPKWSTAVYSWEFVNPFLYVIGDDKVTIVYLNDDAYRTPPCTCDTTSVASTASDCYLPEIFTLKMKEPVLLGAAPNGIIIRSKSENGFNVSLIEGMAAFRSVGASVESLATISDTKGSTTDLAQSTDGIPQDVSQESVEVTTGFLADIRKRARQLRNKHRKEQTPDDVIKEILTTEVDLKRTTNGRKSPATISEFDSDTDSDHSVTKTESPKVTADICAEMFTRQVRFQ